MKKTIALLKPYLRWMILGGTLFYLAKAFKDRWQEVASLRIEGTQWGILVIAFGVTFLAHVWSGWVWYWILRWFRQSVTLRWVLPVYLKTNIAKYLPGNVWHFYGRVNALQKSGTLLGIAVLSVLLEPLLMAASALILGLMTLPSELLLASRFPGSQFLPFLGLGMVLCGIHPRFLNPVIEFLSRSKIKDQDLEKVKLTHYPLLPLLGALGFVCLRGMGFLFAFATLSPVNFSQIFPLLSAFSFAWFLGLIVPTPGGLGVFETTAIALLNSSVSTGVLLSILALYRGVSILAEGIAAGLAAFYNIMFRD